MTEPEETTREKVEDEVDKTSTKRLLRWLFVVYVLALAVVCLWQHKVLFAWPAGIVTGNLLASAIWAPLAVVHLDSLARRHHRERMAQAREHHMAQMHLLRTHHKKQMSALTGKDCTGS